MPLPRSFVLVAWANAWLAGEVSVDEVTDALRAEPSAGIAHHVHAADPLALGVLDSTDAEPLSVALGALRRAGTRRFGLALPVPGDPLGLAGPRGFTERAVDVGEAVICEGAGLGLVPHAVGAGVQWAASAADAGWPDDLSEADGRLATAVTAAAGGALTGDRPADTGLAGAEIAARIRAAGRLRRDALPPGAPARATRLVARAGTCLALVEFGRPDVPGAAALPPPVLRELSAAARRALVAAADACRAGRSTEA